MEDLNYIYTLGFSASDIVRAVIIAFFFAMLTRHQGGIWKMAAFAFVLDRFIWPLGAQAITGAEIQTIYASIGAWVQTFPQDLGVYLVRYLGIAGMMSAFVSARAWIHKNRGGKAAHA